MEEILKLENATKKFKNKVIFENLNLSFCKGESYGFVGANGSGKSVLFKVLCGYSLLTSGKVIYKGKIIGKDQDFLDDAGVVIEDPEFINTLSGYRNLKLLADIRNQISDTDILEIMKKFNLYEDKDKKVSKYSLGMKQKLRLAQALMEKPSILILDEPMNGLDKKSVKMVEDILKQFLDEGGTLFMTSHHDNQIEACCNKIYEIEEQSIELIQ